jgi:AcrR family transcriptional regulator
MKSASPITSPEDRPDGVGSRGARERILASAYELFSRRGTRAVGIEAIVSHSGVARMTLYRNFTSKDELVLAFLARREQQWTRDWLQAEVHRRASEPRARLLAVFEIFDEWFHSETFEGCSFINVMLETADRTNPLHQASTRQLERIRAFIQGLAQEAKIPQPEDFARKWHILMKGAIVAAGEGDREAARAAREMGTALLNATPSAA